MHALLNADTICSPSPALTSLPSIAIQACRGKLGRGGVFAGTCKRATRHALTTHCETECRT